MRKLLTIGKWLLIVLLVLLLVASALWTLSRALHPTEAQRQAMVVMERWPDFEGENAFALLWTLNRAVPDDQLEAVMAEDVRAQATQPWKPPEENAGYELPTSEDVASAAAAYRNLKPSDEDRARFCPSREGGCLQRVRDDPEGYAALMERHAALLERLEQVQAYGYVRSPFPLGIYSPRPSYANVTLLRTRHAVQFVNGEPWEAVAAACRELLAWRRLAPRADTLIVRMLGDALSSRELGWLLADMLAELPVDAPLPGPCAAALAPPTAVDLSLCNAMRGEYAVNADLVRNTYRASEASALVRLPGRAIFDPDSSLGLRAEGFLTFCDAVNDEESVRARREALQQERYNLWRFECFANQMGCTLEALSLLPYGDYEERVHDHGARLRALGTLAWMRAQAGQGLSPEALLAARPAELNDATDAMAYGPDGTTLRIALRSVRRGETHWSIPLPRALHAGAREELAVSE